MKKKNNGPLRLLPAAACLLALLCCFAGRGKNVSAAQTGKGAVTYETTDNYVHTIYANGQPLLIAASKAVNYAMLYVDSNGNGTGDAGEEITSFIGDGTKAGGGIYYVQGYGYFLPNTTVYGGSKDGGGNYDTSVTVTGVTDSSENKTVWAVYGGNADGTLTGSTHINISGGNVGSVYGGSAYGQINGSTNIDIKNAKVGSVYGGNCYSGRISGSTNLVFGENTVADGWIYGGGAGRVDGAVAEVSGSTNIVINGGEFRHNIYGGGGWRGAKTGGANITLNGGEIINGSWIYGGGEEKSAVSGKTVIKINGGTVKAVCAAGAGFNGTRAEVGDAEIYLNGGNVGLFSALPNNNTVINGSLKLELSGKSFSDTELYIGRSGNQNSLKSVSVSLRNGGAALLKLQSKVEESLTISFENAWASDLILLEGTLDNTKTSSLIYTDCGSLSGGWGDFVHSSDGPNWFADIDNPLLTGSHFNKNKFDIISLKNTCLVFYDDSDESLKTGLDTCAGKLVADGGALRVVGDVTSDMPRTQFINNPMLLRTGSYYNGIRFTQIPDGSAHITWLDSYGKDWDLAWSEHCIVQTPDGTPDDTFTPALAERVIKIDGTGAVRNWYVGTSGELCRCSAYSSALKQDVFPMTAGSTQASFTLEDEREGSAEVSSKCQVVGHKGTAAIFTYSIIPDGTDAPGAVIKGNRLTVKGAGTVHLAVKQELNGKVYADDAYLNIFEVSENAYIFAENMAEEVVLSFEGADFNLASAFIYNYSERRWLNIVDGEYKRELADGALLLRLDKEYLNSLEKGEYIFHAQLGYSEEGGVSRIYHYGITVKIVELTEVRTPVIELSQDRFNYDGTPKEPEVTVKYGDTVIPSKEYNVTYDNNIKTGTAFVTVTNKEGGIYLVHDASAEFQIVNNYRPENGKDYTVNLNGSGWAGGDFIIKANDGYLICAGNTLEDEWVSDMTRTEETADGSVTFYVKNIKNGEISLAVTEDYKIDRSKPESFDISFNGNSVKKLLNALSFGLLFRENIDVNITAGDSLSGIENISYYKSEKILTEEQLNGVAGWISGDRFCVTAADAERFIIYARAADRAGNIRYFASNGAEFDLTAPVIAGVSDKGVYYALRPVIITDKNIDSVTLNGSSVSGNTLLLPDTEGTYVIKAVDKLGNETEVTVTMKPIDSLVNSADCLLEDKAILEEAKAALEKALGDFDGIPANDDLKREIMTEIERVSGLLESIGRIKAAADIISGLPDADSVSPDDTDAERAAKLAESMLGNMSEREKALVDTSKLDSVLAALVDYRIIEGDGSNWIKEKDGSIIFKANGYIGKFTGILVDGNPVSEESYAVKSGSTVVALKESYLKTLSVGKHSITVLYSDGEASAEFEIRTETAFLPLGDSRGICLFAALMLISAAVFMKIKPAGLKKYR